MATEKTGEDTGKRWLHNFWVSDAGFLEKVHSNLKIGRKPGYDMLDTYVKALIRRMFMTATMIAAVHLGKDYEENLRSNKNTRGKKARQLFDISQLLIEEQEEIIGT